MLTSSTLTNGQMRVWPGISRLLNTRPYYYHCQEEGTLVAEIERLVRSFDGLKIPL